jgi:hypothetical protein
MVSPLNRMLRALFLIIATGAVAQNTTQCGTTGIPCPSPSPAPTKLPCCMDPARCMPGQLLCPTPSPTLNTTAPRCCSTYDCYNATGLPPCQYSPPPSSPSASSSPKREAPSSSPSATASSTASSTTTPKREIPSPSASASPSPKREIPSPSASASPSPKGADTAPSSEPSQRPSQQPKPSSEPSQRPSQQPPEFSSKPTERPSQQPPEFSSEPTPRPSQPPSQFSSEPTKRPTASAPPTQRPSRRPAASLQIPFSRSPAPSRFPVRSRIPAPTSIVAMESTLHIYNPNTTRLNNTGTLQQITASIACALRLPLEQIQLKNITKRVGNNVTVIVFDPSLVVLSSNGIAVCFVAGGRRLLRRLSTTDTSLDIQYIVIDPTLSLLSMNPAEFSSVVGSDPAIQSLVTTLEGSGAAVEAPPELALATDSVPAPAAPSDATGASITVPVVVGVVLGAAVISGFVAAGVVLFLNRTRKPSLPAATASKSPAVLYVVPEAVNTVNPMSGPTSQTRMTFQPQGTRV